MPPRTSAPSSIHEVDDRRDRGESIFALRRRRRLERNVRLGDAGLCARDALLHGRFGDEERARDARERDAADDAERERELLRRRELRMTAYEEEAQDVVAVIAFVDSLGDALFGVVEIGEVRLGRELALLRTAAHTVDRRVPADEDEPRRRVTRRAVLRPVRERAQARLLIGLLRDVEIAERAEESRERLGTRGHEGRFDPGELAHGVCACSSLFGRKTMSGRISKQPFVELAAPSSFAVSMACSREAHSTT